MSTFSYPNWRDCLYALTDGLRNFFKPFIFNSLSKILILGSLFYTISLIICLYFHTTLLCLSGFWSVLKFRSESNLFLFLFKVAWHIQNQMRFSMNIKIEKCHQDVIETSMTL